MKWSRSLITTERGKFEVFVKGEGAPLCVTHHYSEFNETGDYFAETFTATNPLPASIFSAGNCMCLMSPESCH